VTRSLPSFGRPRNAKALAAVAAGLVGFTVLGYLVLIAPQRSRAASLDDQIAAARQQLAAAEISSQTKPVPTRVDDYFRLTKAMPDNTDMPGILLELSKVASSTGIDFDAITPSAPVAGSGYEMVPIELSFRGTYYQLSDFLFRLRNLVNEPDGKLTVGGRLYSVDGITFSGGTGKSLQAKVTAKAYVYGTGDASAAPSAAPTAPATGTGS
jgi:type IV pilus assembly protein PilO